MPNLSFRKRCASMLSTRSEIAHVRPESAPLWTLGSPETQQSCPKLLFHHSALSWPSRRRRKIMLSKELSDTEKLDRLHALIPPDAFKIDNLPKAPPAPLR